MLIIEPVLGLEVAETPVTSAWKAASTRIRYYCRWHISPKLTHTVKVAAYDGKLYLPTLAPVAVTSVTNSVGHVIDVTGIPAGTTVLARPERFSGTYTVTLEHGFEECPADILEVLTAMTMPLPAGTTAKIKTATSGPHSVSLGGAASAAAAGLTDDQAAVLDAYWLPWAP